MMCFTYLHGCVLHRSRCPTFNQYITRGTFFRFHSSLNILATSNFHCIRDAIWIGQSATLHRRDSISTREGSDYSVSGFFIYLRDNVVLKRGYLFQYPSVHRPPTPLCLAPVLGHFFLTQLVLSLVTPREQNIVVRKTMDATRVDVRMRVVLQCALLKLNDSILCPILSFSSIGS